MVGEENPRAGARGDEGTGERAPRKRTAHAVLVWLHGHGNAAARLLLERRLLLSGRLGTLGGHQPLLDSVFGLVQVLARVPLFVVAHSGRRERRERCSTARAPFCRFISRRPGKHAAWCLVEPREGAAAQPKADECRADADNPRELRPPPES